ncbi:MAG: flagellar basal body rod protein FlgC [bacterium]
MFSAFDTSASGLTAQRLRMDTISDNIANVNTTRTSDGEPYRRKVPVFEEKFGGRFSRLMNEELRSKGDNDQGRGVVVRGIVEDDSPLERAYRPKHPDADEDGYVSLPNIDVTSEMANMIEASRAYEANITALDTHKNMAQRAIQIGG